MHDINTLDKLDSFAWADGSTWKHPLGHPGHQEWHGRFRAGSGSQWPTKYHADIRQLDSAVPQSRTGQAQLWPKHTGVPHESEEEPTTEARLTAKDHHPRLDWCKLYWQMVKDDLPNCLFLLQHCLLALLCQLKGKRTSVGARTNSKICCSFLVCIWFVSFCMWSCNTGLNNYIQDWIHHILEYHTCWLTHKNLIDERLQTYKVPVPE